MDFADMTKMYKKVGCLVKILEIKNKEIDKGGGRIYTRYTKRRNVFV